VESFHKSIACRHSQNWVVKDDLWKSWNGSGYQLFNGGMFGPYGCNGTSVTAHPGYPESVNFGYRTFVKQEARDIALFAWHSCLHTSFCGFAFV
jgi:hypothetical protein